MFDLQANFWCNSFFACLVHSLGLWPSGRSQLDPPRNFMQNGLVEKFRALTATRFLPFLFSTSSHFCFQLRPPISGEPFFEPAPQFKSLPPLCPPNIQSNTKINLSTSTKNDQTAADIHRFFESMSTTSIFWLHNINLLPPSKGGGKLLNWGASWAIGQTRNPQIKKNRACKMSAIQMSKRFEMAKHNICSIVQRTHLLCGWLGGWISKRGNAH